MIESEQRTRRDGAVDRGPRLDAATWLQLGLVMTVAAGLYLVHSLLRFRNYEAKGYFRPQVDCIMFTRDRVPFCAVCQRGIERVIDLYAKGKTTR